MAEQNITIDTNNIDNDSNESKQMLTPQNARQLKMKLFELFKEADIDDNNLFDFDEFSSVINTFRPNTKQNIIKQMFDTLEANDDGNISYVEFLNDTNFNKFMEYCGFVQYPDNNNNNNLEIDIDNDSNQTLLTSQDALILKSQLFELCQQGDIDKNELIDFNEFESVINKFLPNTSNKKMKETFNTLDENDDGNISYVEFLSDTNFTKFLEHCGYFISGDNIKMSNNNNNNKSEDIEEDITEFAKHNILNRKFSVRNAHDKQIILAQKEVIEKLNFWINKEGKPAKEKVDELIMLNEDLQQEIDKERLEIETIKSELLEMSEEKKALQIDYEHSINHKKILSEKLKDTKDELNKNEQSLEEYYEKDKKFKNLQSKNKQLLEENNNLKIENKLILDRNDKFEEKNNLLQNQLNERIQQIEVLNEEENDINLKINQYDDDLRKLRDELNEKNTKIDDLNQQLALIRDSDTYRPFTSSMAKTIRGGDLNTLKTLNINNNTNTLSNIELYTDSVRDYNNNNDVTERGFHAGLNDNDDNDDNNDNLLDVLCVNDDGVRPSSQSIVEQEPQLQAQLFEYQEKESKWNKDKQDFEAENDRLNKEMIGMSQRINELEQELNEEKKFHELDIKEIEEEKEKERETVNAEMIGIIREEVVSSGNEDEKSPLVNNKAINNKRTQRVKKKADIIKQTEDNDYGCVCFSCRLW